jgi:hypothetical protein
MNEWLFKAAPVTRPFGFEITDQALVHAARPENVETPDADLPIQSGP